MRTGQKLTPEILGSMVGAALLAAVLTVGAVRAADMAEAFGPGVGDIVDFPPGTAVPSDQTDRIGVHLAEAAEGACVLDIAALAESGGSLVVESRSKASYRVHWAGGRTSKGSADCGAAQDLVISRPDLDQLASAAGGFGVAASRVPMRLPDASAAMR
jgi:hypothetical protein